MSHSHPVAIGNANWPGFAPQKMDPGTKNPPWCRQQLIDEVSASLAHGSGRGVVVVGRPGVGKTFLARKALEQLGNQIFAVPVNGSSIAASIPYGALRLLLNDLDEAALAGPLKVASSLGQLLQERAKGRRVVLLLDNVEGLDDLASLVINRMAVQHDVRLLALTEDLPVAPCGLISLWKDGLVTRIDLAPFSMAETTQWLRSALANDVSAAAIDALWTASGGNARLLEITLREHLDAGVLILEDGVWVLTGQRFEYSANAMDTVLGSLNSFSTAERKVLELLALSGGMPLERLLSICSIEAVDTLTEHGFLRGGNGDLPLVSFDIPLLEQVVRQRVPRGRSCELRRLTAAFADPQNDPPDKVSMAVWTLDCNENLAVHETLDAMEAADRASDPDRVLRLVSTLGPEHRAATLGSEARAYAALGDAPRVRSLLSKEALQRTDLSLRSWVELMVLRSLHVRSTSDDQGEARALLDEVGARLAGLPTDWNDDGLEELRGRLALAEAELALFEGKYREASDGLQRMYSSTRPQQTRWEVACRLAQAWMITGRPTDAEGIGSEDIKQDIAQPGQFGWPTVDQAILEAASLGSLGSKSAGRSRKAPCGEFARGRQVALCELSRGLFDAYCGRAEAALQHLLPARSQLKYFDSSGGAALAGAVAAYAYALRGENDLALHYLSAANHDTSRPSQLAASVRSFFEILASAELASKQKAAVRLVALADGERRHGSSSLELMFLSAAVRQGCLGAAPRLATVAAGVQGLFAQLCRRYAEGICTEDARSLVEVAETAADMGDDLFARDCGRVAQKIADQAGDRLVAKAARRCINTSVHSLGVSQTEEDGPALTAREEEIARRAAAGESNKAIAAKMSISVRTVEGHLYQIYGKLRVSNRAELKTSIV